MAEIVRMGQVSKAPYPQAGVDEEGGFLFEPRAFWDVSQVDTETAAASTDPEASTVQLSREHFRNGGRWPIKLTRLTVAPINYTLTSYDCTPTLSSHFRNAAAAVNFMELVISSPNRQHYSKLSIPASQFAMRPTAEPTMRYDADAPYASGIWGVSHMRFDKALRLPPKAAIEMDLGAIRDALTPAAKRPYAQVAFLERGGGWNGNVRAGDRKQLSWLSISPPDALPMDGFTQSPQGVSTLWPADARVMDAGTFVRADPSRNGSLEFDGFTVWIDQQAYDLEANTSLPGGLLPGGTTNIRVAPMSTRIQTRIRTRNGGTGTWWWRPGAPLCLVANELGPAMTYDLPQPITLQTGDTLDVQFSTGFGVAVGLDTFYPTYNLGVALTGYAIIEG